MAILTYKGNKFFLDGEEYTIISGAMHYFRIPRMFLTFPVCLILKHISTLPMSLD